MPPATISRAASPPRAWTARQSPRSRGRRQRPSGQL